MLSIKGHLAASRQVNATHEIFKRGNVQCSLTVTLSYNVLNAILSKTLIAEVSRFGLKSWLTKTANKGQMYLVLMFSTGKQAVTCHWPLVENNLKVHWLGPVC